MNAATEPVSMLSPEKAELLELLLQEESLPLSFAQQRLWFFDQLEPGSPLYNIPAAVRLNGLLNIAALEQSLNEIARRHQVLRTTFATVRGQPLQKIAPIMRLLLPIVDLRTLPEAEREAEAQRLAGVEARQPFDLSQGPLLRVQLLHLAEAEHVLLLTMHHIISDGWSLGVLVQELVALYTAFTMGQPSPLAELPIQYADYAVWQREWLSPAGDHGQGNILEEQLAYWKNRLKNLAALELPTDRIRPATQTYRGARHALTLPLPLTRSLVKLSQREGVTLFMTLLAAFQVLLHRYMGQDDITVGSPVANRRQRELEGLIGFFANTLVLRTDLSGNPTFRELLQRVRAGALGAYAHQDLPFEKLVEELQPERHLSYTPLFQVMFALQNAPLPALELPGLIVHPQEVDAGTAKFDLTLNLEETPEGLSGWIEYGTDLFEAATIARMAGHFQTLLEGIIAPHGAEQRLSELPLLTQAEQQQLRVEWNDTQTEYPKDKCIHQLFEAQVEQTPDAVALVFEDKALTYVELNRQANQLAHHLQKLGVGPDVLVSICVERSVEMVVGLLGILKTGGAYLPLDPTHPQERQAFILEDARVGVLLTQKRPCESLPEYSGQVIDLDTRGKTLPFVQGVVKSSVNTENLAYVIYTSGSTGKPKGVQVYHGAVVNFLEAMRRQFSFTAQNVLLSVTTLSFDIAGLELYMPLLAGGRVIIARREDTVDGIRLAEQIAENCVTVMQATPMTWRLLLASGWCGDVKLTMLCGGEIFPRELACTLVGQVQAVWNLYGPTETTIWSAVHLVKDKAGIVPIGRPVANTHMYLLDRHLNPVPVGVPGELYIGGAGLARGYLNRPELTLEKFVPNPSGEKPGVRLYRTGDLARYLPDGNIEFLGRIDHQAKIHGFRIELGEIEAVVAQHPAVRGAAVLVREDVPDHKQLVAYIVLSADHRPQTTGDSANPSTVSGQSPAVTGELRTFLRKYLPDYMLPSAFVFLEALPLTPNGKLDRRALPAPDQTHSESEGTFIAPRTFIEEILAGIWAQVLGLEKLPHSSVNVHDNFFALGGHSLLGAQLVSRVRKAFGVELPLRQLFEAPTVAELAKRIEMAIKIEQGQRVPPLRPVSREGELPLSFIQERLWFLHQWKPDSSAYNIHVSMRLSGPLDLGALQQGLDEIIRRHRILRTTFIALAGQAVQVIAPALKIQLPAVDLQEFAEWQEPAREIAAAEARQPFDLEHGPLLRAIVLKLGTEEYLLLLTMHHIISDGWSLNVLVRELASLYPAFIAGQPSPLAELEIQYTDFAAWQRQWLQGEVLEAQLDYWKQQLGGDLPVLELPSDRPWSAVQTTRGAHQTLVLPTSLAQALRALCQQEGSTLFMTLLAAFKTLLYRYTGQTDIIVGAPIAGRNQRELEDLIGCFLNTLALRTDLAGAPSFRQLLQRVRAKVLEAYTHQDLPFEKLVEELKPARELSRNPIFDIMFNFVNTPRTALELGGMHLCFPDLIESESKFAMTLYAAEQDDGTLNLRLVYQRDLFSAERMAVLLDQFHYLLEQIVASPECPISAYSLVTPASRVMLPDPSLALPEPQYELITDMFMTWAERLPQQPAICQKDQSWTYGELADRAQTIARQLVAQGLERGDVVAVYGARSFGLIAGMLGVFLSGGVLLTIDPRLPGQRRRIMLCEARARRLLCVQHERPEIDWLGDIEPLSVIHLDPDSGRADDAGLDALGELPTLGYDDAAYIFFTSGTTAVPKGVLGCHKGLAHFLTWQRARFAIGPHDRAAQLTALSFDVVLRDIFTPLTSGATLCLPQEDDDYDPQRIVPWLERERISILHTVPALAQMWLTNVPPGISLQNLRLIFFAGEPLKESLVRRWRATFGAGEIVNLYGPTETTLAKCYYCVPADPLPGIQPVGATLPETQALVLSQDDPPCGIGEAGEIVIRTPFRSLGYLNATPEDRQRFIRNPFRDDDNDLLYFTGDRGRYRPDGTLEILGRLDNQVKIHGARVELGEIETVLTQHPAVQEAVVLAFDSGHAANEKRLAAFIVPSRNQTPTPHELRRLAKDKLPDYMIPSAFVMLSSLPLLPNGKVDRRALLAPDWSRIETRTAFVEPNTPIEKKLAGIWAAVLNVEQVGVNDNFFELGGHSLLAIRIVSQVRQAFQVELGLRTLFEEPTVAALALAIARNQATQAEQPIRALKGQEQASQAKTRALSFAQERLWFLDQLEPGLSAYHIHLAVRLTGRLDPAVLKQSLDEIVRRHETLRTVFAVSEGQPVQVITPADHEQPGWPLRLVDLTQMPQAEQPVEIHRWSLAEAQQSFDLARGPLARATLLRLEDNEHTLLLTLHHIISDAWSTAVLVQELALLYRAFASGQPSPLSALPIQYGDFAAWQRERLQGPLLEVQLAYWKQQLGGNLSALDLPCDHVRPAVQSFRGARYTVQFPSALYEKIQEQSRQEGVSLFMTLLTAFEVLLHRYTGQEDVIVGSPVTNRSQTEVEGLIGLFVNMLVLRTNLSGNPTFRELLGRVRQVALEAYAHSDLPFEKLVEELQPQRDLSRSPLFQVMFALQNAPWQVVELPELELSQLPVERGAAQFDLSLHMIQKPDGLEGTWEYNTDLLERETIEQLAGHYQALLEGIVADPDLRLSDLPLLTDAEQARLAKWNATVTDWSWDGCLHQLVEAQVERTPEAIAAVYEEGHLTYHELNRRANQLGHYLRCQSIGPGMLVGVLMERSLEMVIGLMGVLKAGVAYVPLDPEYPHERLAFMAQDARLSALLTQAHLRAMLPRYDGLALCLDTDGNILVGASQANLDNTATPQDLAYVIYTSGSTGQPKGVQVSHRSVTNFMQAMRCQPGMTNHDNLLAVTTLCFDIAALELFLPLVVGARIVLLNREATYDGVQLKKILESLGITVMQATPATWQLLLEAGWEGNPRLKILCGGEALSSELARQLRQRCASLWNMYGPTETTIWATICRTSGRVSIGRPIANLQAYVLDQHLRPVPARVPGELYLGGKGLARGYLGRPDLTADKFIPDPSGSEPGERLYRTGDLARYLPDGDLEFLGRIDHQVKVRGFRIELGEIEAVLGKHPTVRQAVVMARDAERASSDWTTGTGKRLVAYIVPQDERQKDQAAWVGELRGYMKEKLPDYMIPSAFVALDALPLTPNGKVNRAALPTGGVELRAAFVSPRTELERTVAAIWQKALQVEKVGRNDNFFELGGHSLLLIKVRNELIRMLNRDLSVLEMFRYPTIGSLAEYLSQDKNQPSSFRRIADRAEKLQAGEQRLGQQLRQSRRRTRNR